MQPQKSENVQSVPPKTTKTVGVEVEIGLYEKLRRLQVKYGDRSLKQALVRAAEQGLKSLL